MRIAYKWWVLWSLWVAQLVRQPTRPRRVSTGLLRGVIARDGSHEAYLGVPYATVRHERRFQAAEELKTWDGIYEAINEHIRCPQRRWNAAIGQENCLVLNVYTPLNVDPDDKIPVMVFIHGGGFFDGVGSRFIYGPEYLVSKHVILVTINYRLNIQGFLCLGIKEAPGNAGLKDQVAALKWVQENIRVFGGDPDNVTLFGESAGSASVSNHILSPMSKGLFHKAILHSGSSLAAWANQFRPVYMASLLAKTMGYNTEDPHELFNILNSKSDAELIFTRVPRKKGNIIISELLYVPCAEKQIDGVEPFLTDKPYNLLSRGEFNRVPLIIGTNSEEGLLFAHLENQTSMENLRFEASLPKDLVLPEKERKGIGWTVQKMYMGEEDISEKTVYNLSKLHGELYFSYPAFEETELILKSTDKPVYSYLLKYSGWRNVPKYLLSLFSLTSYSGATHADDLFYLFKQTVLPSFFETRMIDIMTTMWTNFAKYGNPTPYTNDLLPIQWTPTNLSDPQSLRIDKDLSMGPLWCSDSILFWKKLYSKYRRTTD